MKWMLGVIFGLFLLLCAAQAEQQPKPQDATSAVVELFHTHNIVMLGEAHDGKQEYEWLCKLVATPEFANHVDDIVVEFGNSLYQKSVDRYVSGEDIPVDEVQKAWRNVIASVPPVSPVYGWFYRAVRESNMARHGKHQIRLLMGVLRVIGTRSRTLQISHHMRQSASNGMHRS